MPNPDISSEVEVATLRSAINLILDHVENDLHIKKITIRPEKDFYWDMNIDDVFKVQDASPVLTIGRVKDDYEFVSDMVTKARDGYDAPSLMLMHVTPLLNLLCDVVRA